jgi:hypothetical protein
MKVRIWSLVGFGVVAAAVRWQLARWFARQPRYRVAEQIGPVEVREYEPLILAETVVDVVDWEQASRSGFQRLSSYIFGGNRQRYAEFLPAEGERATRAPGAALRAAANAGVGLLGASVLDAPVAEAQASNGLGVSGSVSGSWSASGLSSAGGSSTASSAGPSRATSALVSSSSDALEAVVENGGQGESLSMTAPVTLREAGSGGIVVAFVMPPGRSRISLPIPLDPRVRLKNVPRRRIAALRFSGPRTKERVLEQARRLLEALRAANVPVLGVPEFAGYDPPTTFPFLRRNEVWAELQQGHALEAAIP